MSGITASSGSAEQLTFDYMNLLIAQLRNQNPLEPMSNGEMASQLAQFAQLEQLESINGTFQKVLAASQISQASALIGKKVTFYSGVEQQALEGVVDRVGYDNGEVLLVVGNYAVPFEDVIWVQN